MTSGEAIPLLYKALAEPIGLLLQTSDFVRARALLYRARQEAGDPSLACLQFRASPGLEGGDLIIVSEKVRPQGALPPWSSPSSTQSTESSDL
jgi:hypothetical protein